jgi:hypothetical protein
MFGNTGEILCFPHDPAVRDIWTLSIPLRRESIHAVLDISTCFGEDEKAVNDLLSFIIHTDVSNISGRDVLLACLKENAIHENGRYLLPHTVDVFNIGKT